MKVFDTLRCYILQLWHINVIGQNIEPITDALKGGLGEAMV